MFDAIGLYKVLHKIHKTPWAEHVLGTKEILRRIAGGWSNRVRQEVWTQPTGSIFGPTLDSAISVFALR